MDVMRNNVSLIRIYFFSLLPISQEVLLRRNRRRTVDDFQFKLTHLHNKCENGEAVFVLFSYDKRRYFTGDETGFKGNNIGHIWGCKAI